MTTRHLGQIENVLSPPRISNIIIPTCLSLKKDIDLCKLREAVIHVARNQPNLSHGIAKEEDDKYKFVASDPNYEYFEVLSAQTDWKELCVKYGNKMLHDDLQNKPPFKVFFIPHDKDQQLSAGYIGQVYLIPVFLHAVGDGINGMTIVNDILCVYERMIEGTTLNYPKMQFQGPVEEFSKSAFCHEIDDLDGNTTRYEEVKKKYAQYNLKMFKKFNYFLPYELYDNVKAAHQYYLSSCDVYNKFLLKCKEKNVTVGAAFVSMTYFAYASYAFQENNYSLNELFMGCDVPINLRGRVPLNDPENLVNMLMRNNLMTLGIKVNTFFWMCASKVRDELASIFINKFHLLDFCSIEDASVKDLVSNNFKKHGVHLQLCVSNMKKYPHSQSY